MKNSNHIITSRFLILFSLAVFVSCVKPEMEDSSANASVTLGATHISCISVVLSGKANLGKTTGADLKMGIMYSESSGVLPSNSVMVEATKIEAEYNYSISISNLAPNTTYFYRSYVYQGGENTYGDIKSFTTKSVESLVKTYDATEVGTTRATFNGMFDLTDCQYSSVDYGFYYSKGATNNPNSWISFTNSYLYGTSGRGNNGNDYYLTVDYLNTGALYSFAACVIFDGKSQYMGEVKTLFTDNVPVDSVSLDKKVLTMVPEDEKNLYASIWPNLASNKNVTWQSSDNSIATATSRGTAGTNAVIRSKKVGFATITATTQDGNKTAACELTVVSLTETLDAEQISPFSATLNGLARIDLHYYTSFGIEYSKNSDLSSPIRAVSTEVDKDHKYGVSISGLESGTKYYYRSFVYYSGAYTYGEIRSFETTLVSDHVSITSENATNIGLFKATLNGTLSVTTTENMNKSVWFLWSQTATTLNELKASGTKRTCNLRNDGSFSIDLSSLQHGTTYYYVACAKVLDGDYYGEVNYFSTNSIDAVVSTNTATNVNYSEATLNGQLYIGNSESLKKTAWFIYSKEASSLEELKATGTKKGIEYLSGDFFSIKATSLSSGTTYYYVACVKVHDKEFFGEVKSFTTINLDSIVSIVTLPASDIGVSLATINGSVNIGPSGPSGTGDVWFYYSNIASTFEELKDIGIKEYSHNHECSLTIDKLTSETTYYYVMCVRVYDKEFYGNVNSFSTLSVNEISSINTNNASDIGYHSAMLNGSLLLNTTEGLNKSVYCVWSKTASTLQELVSNGTRVECTINDDGLFVGSIRKLKSNTTYYFVAASTIYDKDIYGDVVSFQTHSVPDYAVDLGLSACWAKCNYGAASPEDSGYYLAWGETEPKSEYSWSTYKWHYRVEKYNEYDKKTSLDTGPDGDDIVSKSLGGKWHIPTSGQWRELISNCTWTWTDNYYNTGVSGMIVTSKETEYANNSIFLPAKGLMYDNRYDNRAIGFYWSNSVPCYYDEAYILRYYYQDAMCLIFDSNSKALTYKVYGSERYYGNLVRPVSD